MFGFHFEEGLCGGEWCLMVTGDNKYGCVVL